MKIGVRHVKLSEDRMIKQNDKPITKDNNAFKENEEIVKTIQLYLKYMVD